MLLFLREEKKTPNCFCAYFMHDKPPLFLRYKFLFEENEILQLVTLLTRCWFVFVHRKFRGSSSKVTASIPFTTFPAEFFSLSHSRSVWSTEFMWQSISTHQQRDCFVKQSRWKIMTNKTTKRRIGIFFQLLIAFEIYSILIVVQQYNNNILDELIGTCCNLLFFFPLRLCVCCDFSYATFFQL